MLKRKRGSRKVYLAVISRRLFAEFIDETRKTHFWNSNKGRESDYTAGGKGKLKQMLC